MHEALSMLVHGESKAGKSLLAVSTPPPRLLLDVESAARFLPLKSITWNADEDPPPAAPKNGEWDTCVVPVRTWTTAISVMRWLQSGDHPFVSVSVDSISELQFRYVEHVSKRAQMKIQDWGAALREVGGFVRDLRDLTMHPTNPMTAVVLTAMTKEGSNDGILRPYLQGQLGGTIPYLLDVTAYLYVEEDENGREVRKLRTRRKPGQIEAGERVGGRIPALMTLPVISGKTDDEVIAKNKTYQTIMSRVFRKNADVVEKPAQTAPTPKPDAENTKEEGK